MGTYDRSLQWRMMQQRHPHGSHAASPYFASGYSALGTTAGGERRSAGLQALCPTNTTNSSANSASDPLAAASASTASSSSAAMANSQSSATNYYATAGDDRQVPLKRQRLAKHSPRGVGGPQRANALASYLPSSAESYSHSNSNSNSGYTQQPNDSYGAASGEFGSDSWFSQRSSASGGSTGLTVNTSNSYASGNETSGPTSGGLSRQTSLASPTTMFGMENLMADYESGFYSLWNGQNGANVMGYDSESTPSDVRQSSQGVYMADEELKMDYPQLPDLNQGDLDYIYGTMDTSGGRNSEPHIERSYASLDAGHRKRDRPSDGGEGKLGSGLLSPTQTSLLSPLPPSGFRNLARTTTIETKRPAPPRSQATASSYHGESSSSSALASTPLSASSAVAASRRQQQLQSSSLGSTTPGAKRPRSRQCDFPGCENRARSHQKCKKHGGAHQCVYEGCQKNSQSRGLCIAHGGGSRCKVDGCTRASQSKGRCKSHGGGEYCAVEGCRKKAHLKHLCRTHGGGVRCKDPKCMKWAQRKGWCMAHAKEVLGT